MSKRITRADVERAKNPFSLMSHQVDVHDFAPIKLAKNVIIKPAPTAGELAKFMMKRKRSAG